jgi:BCD family chlorophyll transporter-like MFS transporter
MIKELAISATLVAILASLPYLFSPIQVAIGSFSDRHPLFGWRRTPYIFLGLLLCVLGVVISPLAAFTLAKNFWVGIALGSLAFGAWGMGYNLASVSYLSLASELSGEKGHSKTIIVMFFMMITSIIVTAIALGRMVDPYTPQALERAFWAIGLIALALGIAGLIKLEKRSIGRVVATAEYSWLTLARAVFANRQAALFFIYLVILLAAILGQDVLLEPFAAEAFGLPVQATTRITSIWGTCVLIALILAGLFERRVGKRTIAQIGGSGALAGFILIAISGISANQSIFYSGVMLLGIGTGLSTVSNLSLMLDMTIAGEVGLYIGAWGMANSVSRLTGSVLAGIVRDAISSFAKSPVTGYVVVFAIEAFFITFSLWLLGRVNVGAFRRGAGYTPLVEQAALANDV